MCQADGSCGLSFPRCDRQCKCGEPCTQTWGGFGICQADGSCLATFAMPNCGQKCQCGTRCTTPSGISGYCQADEMTCAFNFQPPNCGGLIGSCTGDDDCTNGFCLNSQCVEYSGVGESCGGFTFPPRRCEPGLTCKFPLINIFDVGGRCVSNDDDSCTSDNDCPNGFCFNSACVEYSEVGESCGGFIFPPRRCRQGLTCSFSTIPNVGGTCMENGGGFCPPCPPLFCPLSQQTTDDDGSGDSDSSSALASPFWFRPPRCPRCPRCCFGRNCLPCCPPVLREDQPPCRDCGLRG